MIQSWSFWMLRVQMSSTNSVQGETMHANCFEHKIDWDKRCLSLAGAKPMHVLLPSRWRGRHLVLVNFKLWLPWPAWCIKKKIYTVPMKSNRLENQISSSQTKATAVFFCLGNVAFFGNAACLYAVFACMHWPKGRHILWASVQPSFAFGSSCFSFLSQMLKFPWPKATSIYITYHTQKSQNLKTKIFSAAVLPSLAPSWFFSAEAKTS